MECRVGRTRNRVPGICRVVGLFRCWMEVSWYVGSLVCPYLLVLLGWEETVIGCWLEVSGRGGLGVPRCNVDEVLAIIGEKEVTRRRRKMNEIVTEKCD